MQSGLDPAQCRYPRPSPLQQPHILNPKGQQADWGWIEAQHFNVFPGWTGKLSQGVFSIITIAFLLSYTLLRASSPLPLPSAWISSGNRASTRRYAYGKELKCSPETFISIEEHLLNEFEGLTHRRREIRQQTPSATTSFCLIILLELFQARRQTVRWESRQMEFLAQLWRDLIR